MDTNASTDYSPQNRNRPGRWGKWKGVTCSTDNCDKPAECRGLCNKHYQQQKWADGHRPPSANPTSQRNAHLKHRYGIDLAEYERLAAKQNNRCAICNLFAPEDWYGKLVVDHCHDSTKVRGLLCHSCNVGIGHLKSESNTRAAAEYLRLHS